MYLSVRNVYTILVLYSRSTVPTVRHGRGNDFLFRYNFSIVLTFYNNMVTVHHLKAVNISNSVILFVTNLAILSLCSILQDVWRMVNWKGFVSNLCSNNLVSVLEFTRFDCGIPLKISMTIKNVAFEIWPRNLPNIIIRYATRSVECNSVHDGP
jgi:hypothetical protein